MSPVEKAIKEAIEEAESLIIDKREENPSERSIELSEEKIMEIVKRKTKEIAPEDPPDFANAQNESEDAGARKMASALFEEPYDEKSKK